ncbi:TPA: hypothetical protein LM653_001524 [Campylobacter jejuni]|nr:hypothetical protein [Campylobacter jejuni]HBK6298814.1 hypothetical protein [Campylobacter jejuni]
MADLEKVASDLNSASQSLQELREKYNGALDLLDNKNTEITGALYSAKSDALQEIQTISDTATSQISQLKDTSLNLVNEAKNTAIEEVNNAVSGIDTSKEEALLAIEQAKAEQGEKITDLEQAKESITADLNKKSKLLTENLTWTVGSGGDYEDLQTAINEASKYINFGNYTITIKLKNLLSLSNVIHIINVNIPFVNLDFNGFSLNYGLSFYNSIFGKIIKANINSTGNYISAINNSKIILTDNTILNGYDGIISSSSSNITYLNSSNNNITINCQSGRFGIYANLGGKIEVQNSNIECNNGTTLCALTGGVINANESDIAGTSNQSNISFNTFTNNGYILK